MAKTKQEYVAAADSNTSLISPQDLSIPLGEGLMLPRHVNDAVRALMADEAIDLRMSGRPAQTAETFVVKLVENNDALGSMPAQGGFKLEIDGAVNPHLVFAGTSSATVTYTFDTSDESMTAAVRFYADSSQGVEHTTGVSVVGTPGTAGSYTSIAVTEATPRILYYQLDGSAGLGGLAICSASSEALANVTGAVTQAQAAATDAYNYTYIAGATPTSNAEYFNQQSSANATNSYNYTFKAGTAPTNNAEYFFEQAALSAQNAANSETAAFNHTYKTGTSTNANAEYYNEEAQAAKLAAEGHADDAQIALTALLAAVDDNVYLGGHASDPTTDNDGNALLTGAAYYNTTAGEVRFYTGSAWTAVSGGGGGISADANNDLSAGTDSLAYFDLSANSDFQTVQNTANTANSTANTANTTANAALPKAGGTITGSLTVDQDLTVSGTTTTLNTQDLLVEDKSITLASVTTPTEASANGSGVDVAVTGLGVLWTTDAPRIEYSSSNSGLDQYWNLNRGIVAKGWSDAGSNVYDGQITLNCSANSHGITIKSAPHSDNATYDLVLPATITGAGGKVLAQNSANNQLEFVDVVKPASFAALASLTTVVGSTNVDVRRAKIETAAASADFAGDARFYNATAAVTLTMDDTALAEGDIITIYANGNDVTIAQDATNGFDTIKIDGTTAAHSGNVTVANGTIATISVISATAGSSFAVIAGQGVS